MLPAQTMQRRPNETQIRDRLAGNLALIEPGLSLVDREFYLRNSNGASGFLDIFARSGTGQLVIVEIKRTRSAAREAVQELFKYAALIRKRYLIRDVEYRLVLLSVDWVDLLTPFSEFLRSSPYEVSAGRIVLDGAGWPKQIEPVRPAPVPSPRRIGVRHFLWRFPDRTIAAAAVSKLAALMQEAGLADFVLVESQSSNPLILEHGFVYFAQQELRFGEYLRLIRRNLSAGQREEFEQSIADLVEEEDRVAEASDAVWSWRTGAPGRREVGADNIEISNPEKAGKWFAPGQQVWTKVRRFGRFNDERLTDETIIAEIVGEGGESDYRLRIAARTDSPPQMRALIDRVENIFFFNADWRGAVRDLINYAQRTGQAAIELLAYSNEDILRGIAGAAFGFPGYLPTFRLDVTCGEELQRFIGLPEWDGTKPDFDRIIADHFSGDRFGYFMAAHFGENRSMNLNIMNDLGLRYGVYREGAAGPERVRVQGSAIVVEARPIRGSVFTMISENVEEVHKVVELFMEHDMGFGQVIEDFLNSDRRPRV